nr:hypothetical protein [Mesorhizobium sp.]
MIKDADGIRFFTKNGFDWTTKYRALEDESAALEAESFIIEGETIVTNEAGLSDFHALRSAITRRPQDLYLVAFDLLHLNGHDLRDMALKDRREILQALIPVGGRIQFSEAMPGTGDAVYHLACEAGLEGIVSKRLDSVYRSGSTMNWRKIKCYVEKEMDIIGVKRETGKLRWCSWRTRAATWAAPSSPSKPTSDRLYGIACRARPARRRPKGSRRKRPSG